MAILVSIILPTFNRAHFLPRAIESVLAQSFGNWELIIVDNSSTDDTKALLSKYVDSRIQVIYVHNRGNISFSLNTGIQRSKGEVIGFLNSDDWWMPDKLERQISFFENPRTGAVYGNYFRFEVEKALTTRRFRKKLPSGKILNEVLADYVIGIITVLIRRTVLDGMQNVFDEKYHLIGDFDLMIRIAKYWEIECVQEPISTYRWHGENESIVHEDRFVEESEMWVKNNSPDELLTGERGFAHRVNAIVSARGVYCAKKGQWAKAWGCFYKLPIGIQKMGVFVSIILHSVRWTTQ